MDKHRQAALTALAKVRAYDVQLERAIRTYIDILEAGEYGSETIETAPIEYAPPKPTRYVNVGDKLKYWKTGVETTITRIDGRDIYTEYSTEIPDDALDLQNLDGEFLVWMNGRYEYSDIPF